MGTTTAAPVPRQRAGDRVSEEEYRRLAAGDDGRRWELHGGRLREKPGLSVEHGDLLTKVLHLLRRQLDRDDYRLRAGHARLRRSSANYYVPDVAVVPAALERSLRRRPGTLDAYDEPLPLVVEIWSPSTGDYDLAEKLPEYQRRGDREIWRLHPYERTLRVWRRRPDGAYDETTYLGGVVRPGALPGVEVDLDSLFEEWAGSGALPTVGHSVVAAAIPAPVGSTPRRSRHRKVAGAGSAECRTPRRRRAPMSAPTGADLPLSGVDGSIRRRCRIVRTACGRRRGTAR